MANQSTLKVIGNGWKKKSKKGEDYISLSLDINGSKIKAMMFKSKEKKDEKSPDFRIVVSNDNPSSTARPVASATPAKEESPW